MNATSNTSARVEHATSADRVRQTVVSVSAVVAIVGAMFGSGVFGGDSMPQAAGGVFSADATHIAPAGTAFSIWSVIYAGLIAYTIWQWFPRQVVERHRRIGYWVVASMLLNAVWLIVVQAALLWLSVVVMLVLLLVLIRIFVTLQRIPGSGVVEAIVTDGTMGLYLGWIIVATAANIAAVLAATVFAGGVAAPDVWAVAVLAVAGLVGVALAVWSHGRLAPAAAIAWGLSWVAVGRLTGELVSVPAGIAAAVAAAVVVIVAVVFRMRARSSVES